MLQKHLDGEYTIGVKPNEHKSSFLGIDIDCKIKDLGDILKGIIHDFDAQIKGRGMTINFIPNGEHKACVHSIINFNHWYMIQILQQLKLYQPHQLNLLLILLLLKDHLC